MGLQNVLGHRPHCFVVSDQSVPTVGHDERKDIHQNTVLTTSSRWYVIAGNAGSWAKRLQVLIVPTAAPVETSYYNFRQLFKSVACVCIHMYVLIIYVLYVFKYIQIAVQFNGLPCGYIRMRCWGSTRKELERIQVKEFTWGRSAPASCEFAITGRRREREHEAR